MAAAWQSQRPPKNPQHPTIPRAGDDPQRVRAFLEALADADARALADASDLPGLLALARRLPNLFFIAAEQAVRCIFVVAGASTGEAAEFVGYQPSDPGYLDLAGVA